VHHRIPPGDDRPRRVCDDCGFVNYVNPRVVVGAVSTWESKILLVRRAIEPRKGYWTIPAGFLEVGETVEAGAVRETWEEARARIDIDCLLGVYNIVRIGQVYLVFRGEMLSASHAPGPESEASSLVRWDDIPWDNLAFPSVRWALEHYSESLREGAIVPRHEPHAIHWER
jgi:ADP-ribose pyrophosphatase YjhB (NUDIX family)